MTVNPGFYDFILLSSVTGASFAVTVLVRPLGVTCLCLWLLLGSFLPLVFLHAHWDITSADLLIWPCLVYACFCIFITCHQFWTFSQPPLLWILALLPSCCSFSYVLSSWLNLILTDCFSSVFQTTHPLFSRV